MYYHTYITITYTHMTHIYTFQVRHGQTIWKKVYFTTRIPIIDILWDC